MTVKPHPPSNQFGRLIQTEREERGWSRLEVCRRATSRSGRRYHPTVLMRYETGVTVPNLDQALVLLGVLGIPLSALTEVRPEDPWIDGSADTLAELDDLVAGRAYVETRDPDTGLPDVVEVEDPEGGIGELPEIAEADR